MTKESHCPGPLVVTAVAQPEERHCEARSGAAIQGGKHGAAALDCFVAKRLLAMTRIWQSMIQFEPIRV
jgi:hypothetical protein